MDKKNVEFIKGNFFEFPSLIVLDTSITDRLAMHDARPSLQTMLRYYLNSCAWIAAGNPATGTNSFPNGMQYGSKFFNITAVLFQTFGTFTSALQGSLKKLKTDEFNEYRKEKGKMLDQFIDKSGWAVQPVRESLSDLLSRNVERGPFLNDDYGYGVANEAVANALKLFPIGIGQSPVYVPHVTRDNVMLHVVYEGDPMYDAIKKIRFTQPAMGRVRASDNGEKFDAVAATNELISRVKLNDFNPTDNRKLLGKKTKKGKKKKDEE